jgi:hypothetical protein
MTYVFISHSRENRYFVNQLAEELLNAGYNIWLDDRISYGDRWAQEIYKAIEDCAVFMVVMTPSSYASDPVLHECHYAQGCRRPTIPLWLEGQIFPLYQPNEAVIVNPNQETILPPETYQLMAQWITPKNQRAENVAPPTAKIETHPLHVGPVVSFLPEKSYFVTILQGPDKGKSFELEGEQISLGRSLENGITINDTEISRFH